MDKKLTTDRIKQLEDNANKMKEGGYSDEDIQEMSNQFIEEYGIDDTTTVKKKDIPTQSTFGGSVSPTQDTKTGVSATQSQPADPSVNNQFNMMSFRNPIPENPIAHEDKIAYAKKAYRNNPLVPQGISDEDLHTAIEKNVTKNPDAFNQLAHQVKQKEERDTHIANSSVDELMAQNNDELQHAYKTNTFYEYQQSRFGKAVSYLNDIKDGVNISEKDAEYIKSVAPTAFNELVPDGNLQAAINVNRANKQANDAANAVTFNEAKKAYLTQANVIDASQIATMSDQVKVGEVAAKQNQQKDIEIKNLQLKYPLRQIGNTNYYNEMSTQMDFPPEYYAELKKVNEKYDAIGNYLGGVHGTEFAKTQKDGIVSGAKSAYDIGIESLKIQNKNTYEQYLAGGQKSKEVKSIATKLGIESMLATGDPEIIRKAQIEQSEFFNKYPKELADDTIRRLSVEHFRNIGISNFDNNPMAGTEELDKLANNLPQQNRDYYYNVIRKNAIEQKSANSFNANIKSSTGVVQLMNPGGAVNSLLEGFINPIVSTGKLISDISNIRTKEQISNENLEGVPITKQPVFDKKSLNKRVDEIKAKPKKTYQDLVELQDAEENKSKIPWGAEYVNRISSTIGMVGSIALQSQMLAGVVGDIAGVSSEGLTAMQQGIQTETSAAEIAKYATQLKNIGAGTGQVTMAATMADDMYKSALRLMPNDNQATQRVAYTALLTTMWGAVSRIMPFEKVFQGLTPEAESELANLAKEVTQKSVTKEALTSSLGKVLDKYILPFAKGTATDLTKVTAEMTGAQVITQAANAVANPSEFNLEAAQEAVVHTLLNTAIDMIAVAGMNGFREVMKSPMSIATLSSLSDEKLGQQSIDVVQAQMQKGDITPKDATEIIQIVNTLQDIQKNEMLEVQAIKKLTPKESDMYKVLLLNEKLLRKKMEDSKDAVLNKVYDSQIKESEAKRQNILGEEYIVDSNYNLKSVEDANIEMSDTESVTANGTPEVQGEPKTNTETIADDNQTKNAEVGSGSEASGMVDATTETAPKIIGKERLDNADLMRELVDESSVSKDANPLTLKEKDNIHEAINKYENGEIDGNELKKVAINNGMNEEYLSRKLESKPTNSSEPSSKVSSGVEGDMEDTAKKLEKAIPKSDQMAEAVSALPAEGVINYKDIKTTITSSNYERYFNNPSALNEKARKIYDELIKGGKLRNEKILLSKDGELLDGTNRFKARLALGQTDFKFSIPNETFFTQPYTKTIAELYHKAKKDGSNPELVKVVEGSIAPQEVKPNEPIVEQSKAESKVNFEAKNNDNLGTPEVVVKNSDGEVIGNVTTSFDPKNENVLIVQSIDVKPGNQNKGIGKQLYLELAKNNPDKTIKSSPRLSGEYAIKAWESLVRDGIAEKVGENKYEINSKKEVANSEKLLKEKESEIENLKMEMEAKIRDLKKEKLDIDLPPIKKVAYSESPIENKEKLDSIKKRLSILDDIIKCL